MSSPSPKPSAPIISQFAGDKDMAELVELFVGEMPARIETLRDALAQGKLDALKRAAHQLKGAAGGYGFPAIGDAAAKVEGLILKVPTPAPETQLASLRSQVEQLTDLCARARVSA